MSIYSWLTKPVLLRPLEPAVASPVAVENGDPAADGNSPRCHAQGIDDQGGAQVLGHGVADDLLGGAVQDGRQVQPPLPRCGCR